MSRDADQRPVGYKNPPQHSRFQKGRSGNPFGRRKPKPDLSDQFAQLMAEPIQVMKNGKPRTVTVLEAFLWKTTETALKGDAAARKDVIKLLNLMKPVAEATTPELPSDEEAQLIARFLARQRRSGGGCDA